MSGARAAIARLSLVLRVLLYAALLIAVGYIGFSYSGFIAIPGDMTIGRPAVLPDGGGSVVFFQMHCEKTGSGTEAEDCVMPAPPAGMGALPGNGKAVIHLNEDGTEVIIEREGSASDAKGRITVRKDGKETAADFTGTTLPEDVAKHLPDGMRERIQKMLSDPVPAPGTFFMPGHAMGNGPSAQQRFELRLPPGAMPPPGMPMPPPGDGEFNMSMPPPGAEMGVVRLQGPGLLIQQQLRGHTALRATLVGVTIALVVLAIVQLERLLAHFQQAELFSARNTGLVRNIGFLLVGIALVQAASTLLPAILIKALHPVLIGALGPHLFLVFAGLVFILLAQVMSEAGRLEDEAAHTV